MRGLFLLAVVGTILSCKSYAVPQEVNGDQEEELLEVIGRTIAYPGATGDVLAYSAKPRGQGSWPSVILFHDNDGLSPSTEDLVKQIAARGFYVIAPDGLSQISGTPDVHDAVVSSMDQVNYATTKRNFAAVIDFLKKNPASNGKIGFVGLGWGGKMALDLLSSGLDVDAAVIFNSFPETEKKESIFENQDLKVVVQLFPDKNLNQSEITKVQEELKGTRDLEIYTYPESTKTGLEKILLEENTSSKNSLEWKRTINLLKDQLIIQ